MSSGIYEIKNKVTGDRYIGSSLNIKRRFAQHRTKLRHNIHQNKILQHAWNKYGKEAFEFNLLWNVEPVRECLLYEEQLCFNNLHCKYNILRMAGSTAGVNISDAHKQAISAANKGKAASAETKKLMGAAASARLKGRPQSPAFAAHTAKVKAAARGWYLLNGKYRVRITFKNKKIHIGWFLTQADAEAAYKIARENYDAT